MAKKPITWRTEKRKLGQLKKWPMNPRTHTKKQAKDLQQSLNKFNLVVPLVINTDDTIIGGHFRSELLDKDQLIDVRVPSRKLTQDEVEELNIRLNKNLGQFDFEILSNFDKDILSVIGFDDMQLQEIFKDFAPADDDQERLDEKAMEKCPNCGFEFRPRKTWSYK